MRVRAGLPRGGSAVFFDEARRRRQTEWRTSRALEQQGFDEVILPILDYYAPYETLLAEAEKERLYRFVDRGGQMLALRSDFTPLLARLLAQRLDPAALSTAPMRLFYRGDVVRHQETGPNRLRETSQLGAELIAAPGALADAALLEILLEVALGLIEAELPAASGGGSAASGSVAEVVLGYAGALTCLVADCERRDELSASVARRDRQAIREIGGARRDVLLEIVEDGLPADLEALGAAAAGLREVVSVADLFRQRAEGRGVAFSVDLAEFLPQGPQGQGGTGLHHEYYDGPVFRIYLPGAAEPLASGGRYDALFAALGADVVAAGFSLGLDQLLDVSTNGVQQREATAETASGDVEESR